MQAKTSQFKNAEDKEIKSLFKIECPGSGIAFTNEDNLLVTDEKKQQVLEFTLKGELSKQSAEFSRRSHAGQLQIRSLRGITVHPSSGKVFIADANNHCIHILNNDLTCLQPIGGNWQLGTEDGQFNKPIDIAFDSQRAEFMYEQSCAGIHSSS